MNVIKYIFSLILLCSLGGALIAQSPSEQVTVRASLSPDSIMIGDRITLRIEVSKDMVQDVAFPSFANGMLDSAFIEVMSESALDTVSADARAQVLGKEYVLTCFDAGTYSLGRFPVLVNTRGQIDTLLSVDSLVLNVATYAIDTTTQVIVGIVPPLHTPLKFGEFSRYLLYILIALAVVAAIVYFIVREIRRRRSRIVEEVVPPEAAHIKAIKALEVLVSQKLWQGGHHKEYYTALADIVRTYIEERYQVGALEKATDEILFEMKNTTDARSFKRLSDLLSTADYVKFAKHIPAADDNEDNYDNAYYFIEDTKIVEVEQEVVVDPLEEAASQSEGEQPKQE